MMTVQQYDPQNYDPLKGLPVEYIHGTFHAMKMLENPWTLNRNNIFEVLRFKESEERRSKWKDKEIQKEEKSSEKINSRKIWEILIPYRPELTRFQQSFFGENSIIETQIEKQCPSYEWIINSLHCWFSRSPFTRIEYFQWSISALIDILQCNPTNSNNFDNNGVLLGAKMAQFGIATKVIEDILKNSKKEDLFVLQRCFEKECVKNENF